MDFILAIDQGTTASHALVIDRFGKIKGEGSYEHPQHYPKPGFVEHIAGEIKGSVEQACKMALKRAHVDGKDIAGIGIANQRETTCLFDRHGESYLPFIVWQCRRSRDICQDLKERGLGDFLHKLTGLCLDPYFSASKLAWAFKEHPHLLKKAASGELLFGTIDTYLCHWMSGHELHITDATNASRTMLMDIETLSWSDECLDIFSIPKACLPQIKKSIGPYGKTKGLPFLPDGIPIASLIGDQQAALFGQACFLKGDAKATFGTGCFILVNTGKKPIISQHGLITSIAYDIDSSPTYCLEGSAFIAGAAIEFLVDIGLAKSALEIEELACSVPDSLGLIFVPALCGLGAPHWRSEARGLFWGFERGTKRAHIARATLEGIALQNTDIITAMAEDGIDIKYLKVDGGAAKNDLLVKIQADLLGVPCLRSVNSQKTAQGAGFLAGLALGIFPDISILAQLNKDEEFLPDHNRSWADRMIRGYHTAVAKA